MKRHHVSPKEGILDLGVDSLDDLWTLRNLIAPGDLVTASTTRTVDAIEDKLRAEKLEKKRMTLGVRVGSVEWHDFDDHLRVHGTIETGPQDLGKHHTLLFRDEPGTRLRIQKPERLHTWHLDLVDEAVAATHRPQVLLLAIDDAEAQFAQLASYGLRLLGAIPAGGQGKRFKGNEHAKRDFYDDVLRSLRTLRTDPAVPFLVVGPGWWREEFIEHARAKEPALLEGARTDGTSQGGAAGLREALQRGVIAQVARDHRVHAETERVDALLLHIAKDDGLAAYGPAEVAAAIHGGAVETLLLTDEVVRHGRHQEVLDAAEQVRCPVHIVSTGHDAGDRLQRMGGVAAVLRFAL